MKSSTSYLVIWLTASLIAAYLGSLLDTAALVDGRYIPVGNDSFYHARRILDAAIGERGFYQFDHLIHVPEGSWLNWPWGYDYFMALALRVALWLRPSTEPMAFLAHVPVFWTLINAGLLVLIARQLQLGAAYAAIALLGFSLMPLTQSLHGLGIIDHHFIELTFVLATVWAGLRYFSTAKPATATLLGIVLGLAPAFHNGLFILQIPVLICAFLLWLNGRITHEHSLLNLSAALAITTLLILLPSEPFRAFQFEFWTLSWFHLYVACGSAATLAFFHYRRYSKADFASLAVAATVLVAPIVGKLLVGTAFLAGDMILLDRIAEVRSPIAQLADQGGLRRVTELYSWLIFLTPVLLAVFLIRAWRDERPATTFLSVAIVFGLGLMLMQFRLHPFGSWALLIGSLLLLEDARARRGFSILATSAASLATLALAMQPPLRNQLFETFSPGLTKEYAAVRALFPSLAEECTQEGGAVLSSADDGHYIRYHTPCSVVTNNFIMTSFHEQKLLEADAYLQMTPKQFSEAAPHIRYLFVRLNDIVMDGPDGIQPTPTAEVQRRNAPLFNALVFSNNLPGEFRLVDELRVDDARDFAYARVFKIVRDQSEK